MKKAVILSLVAFATWCQASPSVIVQTNEVPMLPGGFGEPISVFQSTTVRYDIHPKVSGASVTFPEGSQAILEVFKRYDEWLMLVESSVISNGLVRFEATVNDTSIPPGVYRYTARVFIPDGTNGFSSVVIGAGGFKVVPVPFGHIVSTNAVNGIQLILTPTTPTNQVLVGVDGIEVTPIVDGYQIGFSGAAPVELSAISELPGISKEVVTNLTGKSVIMTTFAESIGQLAQIEVTSLSSTNFTYQIRSGSGLMTNAWKIYWMAQ